MKYYLFLDESGEHGMKKINPHYPILVLCGVFISEIEYYLLRERINALKIKIFGTKDVVFHSTEIRKKEGSFHILSDEEIRNAFIEEFNQIVTESHYKVLATVIRKEGYKNWFQNPFRGVYETALSFILERCVYTLDADYHSRPSLNLIIESRGKREDRELSDYIDSVRKNGTQYVKASRFAGYGFNQKFLPKKLNIEGLQMADLFAHPIALHSLQAYKSNVMFDLLLPKIPAHPKKGIYGYGLKLFP